MGPLLRATLGICRPTSRFYHSSVTYRDMGATCPESRINAFKRENPDLFKHIEVRVTRHVVNKLTGKSEKIKDGHSWEATHDLVDKLYLKEFQKRYPKVDPYEG